jgi:hypothetical protein
LGLDSWEGKIRSEERTREENDSQEMELEKEGLNIFRVETKSD